MESTSIIELNRILEGYRQGKRQLEQRIIDAEQFWKLRHWKNLRAAAPGEVTPASGWITNAILSKHSHAVDAYPRAVVLPREPQDEKMAGLLSRILPVILEQADFRQVWSDCWWDKLKGGTGVFAAVWDSAKQDIALRCVDILNLYWKPGIADIQQSPYLFYVHLEEEGALRGQHPELKYTREPGVVSRYLYDESLPTEGLVAVVDCYYKRENVLHFCQFAGETLLYATENDPLRSTRGLYDHGLYPFVFDPLWPEKGYPGCGFGYVDLERDSQVMVDLLSGAFAKNVLAGATPRYFSRIDGAVKAEELLDLTKPIVVCGSNVDEASLRPIQSAGLPDGALEFLQLKVTEMKEVGGNRDVNNGSSGNVTAASAITALQEAGNGLSRDMIDGSYRAFSRVIFLTVQLIWQFYDGKKQFRVLGDGFAALSRQEMGACAPHVDIRVEVQTEPGYSRESHNQTVMELYRLGLFAPENRETALALLDALDIKGKESLKKAIGKPSPQGEAGSGSAASTD